MSKYRERLLQETRDELEKADTKASIMLAASGIAFAALLSLGSSASWYPAKLSSHSARWFAWAAIFLTLLGIVFVGAAVLPRLRARRPQRGAPHYFGDVEAYWPRWWQRKNRSQAVDMGKKDFADALSEMASDTAEEERLTEQIWTLSHIAYRKYRLISIGMQAYGFAIASAVIAVLLEKSWL